MGNNLTGEEKMIESELDVVFNELKSLIISKNKDYFNSFHDIFLEYGMESVYIRLTDMFNRLKWLAKHKSEINDENIENVLQDIINYCVFTLFELEEKNDYY